MGNNELEKWSQMDIILIPKEKLVDIKTVKVDPFAPIDERISCFLSQIRNPYCFLYDSTPVRISFSESAQTLQECMTRYFLSRKRA